MAKLLEFLDRHTARNLFRSSHLKRFNKIARIELSLVNLQLFTRVHPFFNNFKLLKSRNR